MQIDGVLAQIRQLQQQTKLNVPAVKPQAVAPSEAAAGANGAAPADFGKLLRQGLDSVNAAQTRAGNVVTAFERGVPGVELSTVMIESQKATVAFRAATEVRNRLVNAYQEIMNMPI
ncbi:MAG: flagellar hook-basal body complex protein FliE [Steroidobacteraceae bacterium]